MKRTPRVQRKRRHARVRARVKGTPTRPRLCIFRSLNHTYAQIIDDSVGNTICSASTLDREIRERVDGETKKGEAQMVGELIARRAKGRGVTTVVFDRGGYKYHGRVRAVADGARGGGLIF